MKKVNMKVVCAMKGGKKNGNRKRKIQVSSVNRNYA